MVAIEVLNIPVPSELVDRWRGWFAPLAQPFRTDLMTPELALALPDRQLEPTPEWMDTYFMYGGTWTWLTESDFFALRPGQRRALMALRRRTVRPKFVPVWPSELAAGGDRLMFDWVASGVVRPSRHDAVVGEVWDRAESVLPRARQLAGTFPVVGSGPNCFGTVLTAAGVSDAAGVHVGLDTFRTWLGQQTEPVRGTSWDHDPGVVFVWTEHGELAHATVTLGDGWMLTKPSRSWSSPSIVLPVRYVVNSWRYPDTRLQRYRITR